jgi:hypothetical protein
LADIGDKQEKGVSERKAGNPFGDETGNPFGDEKLADILAMLKDNR